MMDSICQRREKILPACDVFIHKGTDVRKSCAVDNYAIVKGILPTYPQFPQQKLCTVWISCASDGYNLKIV